MLCAALKRPLFHNAAGGGRCSSFVLRDSGSGLATLPWGGESVYNGGGFYFQFMD
jgi:hypothetical protein